MKKVVITHAEAVCTLGSNIAELGANLSHPSPAASEASTFEFHQFSPPLPCYRAQSLDPVAILGKKGLRTKDWSTKLLLCALETGFKDLIEGVPEADRPGVCIGTAFGSVESIGNFLSESIVSGVNNVNPQAFANTVINAPTSNANVRFTLRALSATVSTGFNSSLDAMIYAADYLQRGYLDWMVVGGLEEISYYSMLGLQRSGLLNPDTVSRPFAADGTGIIPGEGCALFMVETEDHARARGARVLAEIAGCAAAFDPSDIVGTSTESARFVMSQACVQAGVAPAELGWVAASASGRSDLDGVEARVLAEICPQVPVTAYKRRIGECYGASSVLSIACALTDRQNRRITGVGSDYATMAGPRIVTDDLVSVDASTVLINALSCDGNCGSIILRL